MRLPADVQMAVRQQIEGIRVTFALPALTPYGVGLLVMLGMLGTFLGMVVTLSGTAFALQNLTDVQGIRDAFAEPIKGLGLAFGASVAGVATSALLGLMLTLSKRERQKVWAQLQHRVATLFHAASPAHHRAQTIALLQQQVQLLPQWVDMMGQWATRSMTNCWLGTRS
jgi:hypothetical protein